MRLHSDFSVVALAALLVSGCLTGDGFRNEVHHEPEKFDSTLDSMLSDKRTWLDSPDGPR
jgi:hypothetical protein